MDFAEIQAGQPLSADALASLQSRYDHNGAYRLAFLPGASRPAPLLIQNGWTDDLFPPAHALRAYNFLRSRYPGFPVSLQFGDLGHSRGSNKAATDAYFFDQARGFFRAHLKHLGGGPGGGLGHGLHPDLSGEHPRRRPVQGRELAGDPQRGHHIRLEPRQRRSPRPAAIRTWQRSSTRSAAPRTPARRSAPRMNPTPPRTSTSSPTAPSRCSGCRRCEPTFRRRASSARSRRGCGT